MRCSLVLICYLHIHCPCGHLCNQGIFYTCFLSLYPDPCPSVTMLVRGMCGRHAWTMQLFHQPRGARANQKVIYSTNNQPEHKRTERNVRVCIYEDHISVDASSTNTHCLIGCFPILSVSYSRFLFQRVGQPPKMTSGFGLVSNTGRSQKRWTRFLLSKLI